MPITGDSKPAIARYTKASAIPFTIVTLSDLQDATSVPNTTKDSGKKRGYGFVVEGDGGALDLYIASGDEPTDQWYKMGGDPTEDAVTPVSP